MATVQDTVNAKIKVRAYKNAGNPDGRASLCGEKVRRDEDGREFFEVPGHQLDYLKELLPSYEFSEPYEVGTTAAAALAPRKGRARG